MYADIIDKVDTHFFTAHVPTDVLSLSHFAAASKDAPKPPALTRQAPPGSKVFFSVFPDFIFLIFLVFEGLFDQGLRKGRGRSY